MPEFRTIDMLSDLSLLKAAREEAIGFLEKTPALRQPTGLKLKSVLMARWKGRLELPRGNAQSVITLRGYSALLGSERSGVCKNTPAIRWMGARLPTRADLRGCWRPTHALRGAPCFVLTLCGAVL